MYTSKRIFSHCAVHSELLSRFLYPRWGCDMKGGRDDLIWNNFDSMETKEGYFYVYYVYTLTLRSVT